LLALAAALPADVSEFNRLGKVLTENRNNFEALTAMGKALRSAGLFRTSSEYYLKASQRPEAKTMKEARENILNEIGLNYLDVRDANLAASAFERCLKEYQNSPRKSAWTLNLGRAYAFGDKKQQEKARRVLEGLIRENPAVPESEPAREILSSMNQGLTTLTNK
jgi:tetratricopeptide (TPR) repeat protein